MLGNKVVHIGHDVVLRLLHRLEELVGKLGAPLIARIATGLALDAHAHLVGDDGVEQGCLLTRHLAGLGVPHRASVIVKTNRNVSTLKVVRGQRKRV